MRVNDLLFNRIASWPERRIILMLALASAILFLPFLGYVHLFDWDEANFAEISREMLVTGEFTRVTVNYLPFWEKPPLFFWLQSLSMSLFGVNEFAARFPNALCGIITIPLLFHIGSRLYNKTFGLLWALVYLGCILPAFYFQSGIIDPVFNLFLFLGLYFVIRYAWEEKGPDYFPTNSGKHISYVLLAGLFSGLAILTKGPAGLAILLLVLGVYWVLNRFRLYFRIPFAAIYLVATLLVALTWFGVETIRNGPWLVNEFIDYNLRLLSTEDAGHGGFPGYHFVVVFFGCFPASVFALRAFSKSVDSDYQQDFMRWMIILLGVVLILFSVVQSKIIHYSSLAYFPVTFMGTWVLYKAVSEEGFYKKWMGIVVLSVGVILGTLFIALPILALNPDWIIPLVKDPFAAANMEAVSGWTGFESGIGVVLILFVWLSVRKMNAGQIKTGVVILFLGTALSIKLANVLFVKNIEAYTQRAAVQFAESIENEDAYINTYGFKSYAHYFYARVKPENQPNVPDFATVENRNAWNDYLLSGDIDKPAYIIAKVSKADQLSGFLGLDSLYAKNGFVFYKREPQVRQ